MLAAITDGCKFPPCTLKRKMMPKENLPKITAVHTQKKNHMTGIDE
jgi:hypothetical protein